jgi:hypothetical protein
VDATAALESIAGILASLPDESVEDLLVTFDGLVGVSDAGARPGAALMLRRAAESVQSPTRRDRLLLAAAAVETGQPCALTPEGLTAQQAAAASTVTQEQWDELQANMPPPPLPEDVVDADGEDEDDEDSEEAPYMDEEPAPLPHLRVRHFFSGLVVRVGRSFGDALGRPVCEGELLKLLACNPSDDGFAVIFLGRTVVLSEKTPGHDPIIENTGNAWFQPVPTVECIEDLLEAIDARMSEAEAGDDSEDDDRMEGIETLREDLEACQAWLSLSRRRGRAPRSEDAGLAAKLFGRDHELAAWLPLLFACIEVIDRFQADSAPYEVEDTMNTTVANPGPEYQKFLSSMEITYSDWRDGNGYDLEVLQHLTKAERIAATAVLSDRLSATPNWRDVEALGVIDTPDARLAIRGALEHADSDTRLRAAQELTDLGETVDLEGVIIDVLRNSDLSNGLSRAIDLAEDHPGPRMQETLLDLALNGNSDQRVHCAALALYLGGKADEAFDWNHRPFFLRFGEEDRQTQIDAYKELCQRLGVAPKVQ